MSVLNIIRVNVGEVGVKPGTVKMVSSDNLATVTAAGYINGAGLQLQPSVILSPSDVVECLYNYDASDDSGDLAYLQPSLSAGVVTLTLAPDADSISLAENLLLVGAATGLAAPVALSGDATIVASGALTLAADSVSSTQIEDLNVTNAKLAVDTIKYVEVSIATAQVLLLATTPIELVAAPGAGLVNQFLGAELILDYATTQYTESGDNLVVKFENASGVAVSEIIECTGFIDQAADTLTNAIPVKDNIVAAASSVNKALVLDNNNANFAVGDSPLRLKVTYKVVDSGLA